MSRPAKRDPAVWIMFAVALFLIVLIPFAGVASARGHTGLLLAALVLTGIFAVAGMAMGLLRNVRSARTLTRALKRRSA